MNLLIGTRFFSLGVFCILLIGAITYYSTAQNSTGGNYFEDLDGDGLSNNEEKTLGTDPQNPDTDGDGYRDGVEIESGFDPLKPAPGDKIVSGDNAETPVEGVGGLEGTITEGYVDIMEELTAASEESGEIDQEEIDQRVAEYLEQTPSALEIDPIDQSRLHFKSSAYPDLTEQEREQRIKQDAIDYYTAFTYIMQQNFGDTLNGKSSNDLLADIYTNAQVLTQGSEDFNYFEGIARSAKATQEQLIDVAVPEVLVDEHLEALQTFAYVGSIEGQSQNIDMANDPLSIVIVLQQVGSAVTLIEDINQKMLDKFESLGISINEL